MIVAPAGSVNRTDKIRGDAQAEGDLGIARLAASRMQVEGDLHLLGCSGQHYCGVNIILCKKFWSLHNKYLPRLKRRVIPQ